MQQPATLSYQDIKSRLGFNPDDLDKEIAQQAVIYQMICEETARLGHIWTMSKINRDTLTRKKQYDLRSKYETAGKKVPGVEALAAEVETEPDVIAAKIHLADSEKDHDLWLGLKRAWEMRQISIDETLKMMLSGYINFSRTTTVR